MQEWKVPVAVPAFSELAGQVRVGVLFDNAVHPQFDGGTEFVERKNRLLIEAL